MSMAPMWLVAAPVLFGMAVVIGLVVWVIVYFSRNPAGRPGAPVVTGAPGPLPDPLWWFAHVRRDGHLDAFGGFGTLTLSRGALTFRLDGAPGPAWTIPAPAFAVFSQSALEMSDLMIESAATGRLRVTVNHRSINRFSQNTMKTFEERAASGEFLRAMAACGATVPR